MAQSMGANATLDYGALQVELKAENAEKLEIELDHIIAFLEANDERINSIFGDNELPSVNVPEHEPQDSEDGGGDSVPQTDGPLSRIAKSLHLNGDTLERFILTDDDYPQLYLEDKNLLGDHKTERQRNASLILLYLWKNCYGVDRVKTSELKDALSMSGVSDSNLANMYQGEGDRFFDRTGRGASATIGLTTPGERRAPKALSELVERMENEAPESEDTGMYRFR